MDMRAFKSLCFLTILLLANSALAVVTAGDDILNVLEDSGLRASDVSTNDSKNGASGTLKFAVLVGPTNGAVSMSNNGSFNYEPNANFNGTDDFTYQAVLSSNGEVVIATVFVTVNQVNDAAVFGGDNSGTGNEDTQISGTLTVTDVNDGMPAPSFTVTTAASNGAAVINPTTGTWTYDGAADSNGGDTFTVTVTDDDGNNETQGITILVNPANDVPTFTVGSDETVNEDAGAQAVAFISNGSTGAANETQTLIYNVSNNVPTLFSVQPAISAAGQLTYTSADNANGVATVTVSLTDSDDGYGSDTTADQVFTIAVNAVNDAPTIAVQAYSVDENSPNGTLVGSVIATDIEPVSAEPAQSLSFSSTDDAVFSIDAGGIITVVDGDLLDYEATTSFSVIVTVADNGSPSESDTATITIDLNALNDNSPTAITDAVSVDELETINFNVIANDTDPDLPAGTLTVSEVAGDVGLIGVPIEYFNDGELYGTLTINTDGSATFETTAVNTVEVFTATQVYKVTDGANFSDAGTVTVTINPTNDNRPQLTGVDISGNTCGIASGTTYCFDEDEYLSVSDAATISLAKLFSDIDIDGDGLLDSSTSGDNDSLVFSVINSNSENVSYQVQGTNLRLYAGANRHGTSTLDITATDTAAPLASVSSVTLSLFVTVFSVNDPPIYQRSPSNYYESYSQDEDAGNITFGLEDAFRDEDLFDANSGDDELTYTITVIDGENDAVLTRMVDATGFPACPSSSTCVVSDDDPIDGSQRTLTLRSQEANETLPIFKDAHGTVDITVRATDLGRPPGLPGEAVPLSDQGSFVVTINAIGDDSPIAVDDHFDNIAALVIDEDSDAITFNALINDYPGDVPAIVISAGQEVASQRWRSGSRFVDDGLGDLTEAANGQVSCGDQVGCIDGETGGDVTGAALDRFEVTYKPEPNFNGEDSFVYCIRDAAPADEAAFTPPIDQRCATVTVNVLPVNDAPIADTTITYAMDQADDLIVSAELGLRLKVSDIDNTHIDGLGCNPLDPDCSPGIGEPQADQLYFYFTGAVTEHGQLFSPFTNDGAFNYRPDATYDGNDSFEFQVCDRPTPGDADHCDDGIVTITINALAGAPEGSTDGAVQFDYQLAEGPLELPIGPEPNVLIVNDDSGSMLFEITTSTGASNNGYEYDTGDVLYFMYEFNEFGWYDHHTAPSEEASPGVGLWRLRNAGFNTGYYNPDAQYEPWKGFKTIDEPFNDSQFDDALLDPMGTESRDLSGVYNYEAQGVVTSETCKLSCIKYKKGKCKKRGLPEVCTTQTTFRDIDVNGYYIPRYYIWEDLNGNGELDSKPAPFIGNNKDNANAASEGTLVEIKPGRTYPKTENRSDCDTAEDSCSYTEEMDNFANWFTYYRSRELLAKAALGSVVTSAENLRLGYATINRQKYVSSGKTIVPAPIQSMNPSERTGAKKGVLDAIYNTVSKGGTPLRLALERAGRHYECKGNDIFRNGPDSSPGDANCPVLAAPDGNCQQHFTLLLTDGSWNGNDPVVNETDTGTGKFDGGAFASDDDENLGDVAMHYYERDLHAGLPNEVPTTGRDRDLASDTAFEDSADDIMHQHMTTYTVGFGVTGNILGEPEDYRNGFNWGDPDNSTEEKIDDVRHAAYNGRGVYLDASNAGELADRLTEAFDEFSQGSGAASAVSFNSQEIQQDTLIFRAFYNTKINTGDLIAQTFTDDGLGDEPVWSSAEAMDLVLAEDREIMTYDPGCYAPAICVAGQNLTAKGIAFRPGDLTDNQRAVFIPDQSAADAEQNTEVARRVNYLRGDSENERPVGNFRERPLVGGRLGDIVHSTPVFVGAPNRAGRNAVPFPQEDLYTDFRTEYTDRTETIYVESNDGMLHGFNASDGSEAFGYIPHNLMVGAFSRNITELLNFNYSHKFFVDLTPAVNDVYIDADNSGDKEWTTMLVGGQGAGAKAYFALNITDPTKFDESTAEDVVLWEFTDADDTYPTDADGDPLLTADGSQRRDLQDTPQPVKDLGYSFSIPTLAMSNVEGSDGELEWIALFGNGFNSTSGIAKLYALFLDGGVDGQWCHPDMKHNIIPNGNLPADCVGKQDFVKIDTTFGVNDDGYPNGLGTPRGIDIDGNGTIDYAYAGDTFGNFFRFDLSSSNFNLWNYTKIYEAKYVDGDGVETLQPITTQPIVTQHRTEQDGYIVIFATGSYITVPDGADNEIQSIYGLWDRLSPELLDEDDLVQQRFTNKFDSNFGSVRVLSNNEVDYSTVGGKKGWFNHLDVVAVGETQGLADVEFPGERAIRNIQLRGGLGFVNSIIPRSDTSCVDVAGGFALSFCPGTGGTNCLGDRGIFDLDNDGEFDDGDSVDGSVVAGLRFEDAVPTDSSFIEDKRITQLSDKSLDSTSTNTSAGLNTGRLSWKQLESVD
jgi:type IV pilus assembly protein PilY1|tara:strand:+ start:173 stop:7378 length:7206 start_codon:yes stop_codon:yes gene_type:complete